MPHIEEMSLLCLRIYVLALRYLVWREEQFEELIKAAYWLREPMASYIYPERKKYRFTFLSYSIHLWLSVDSKRDHVV